MSNLTRHYPASGLYAPSSAVALRPKSSRIAPVVQVTFSWTGSHHILYSDNRFMDALLPIFDPFRHQCHLLSHTPQENHKEKIIIQ